MRRAVLTWAKYNAGIPLEKNPRQWNLHEKKLISQVRGSSFGSCSSYLALFAYTSVNRVLLPENFCAVIVFFCRNCMCCGVFQALDGVVNKVKFMLIDSRVFAEEVEPTGVVPMELSLERFVNS